jgi:hypothetical protein
VRSHTNRYHCLRRFLLANIGDEMAGFDETVPGCKAYLALGQIASIRLLCATPSDRAADDEGAGRAAQH